MFSTMTYIDKTVDTWLDKEVKDWSLFVAAETVIKHRIVFKKKQLTLLQVHGSNVQI